MTKYKDIMDRIELTDEMCERVLKNVKEQAASGKTDSSSSSVIKPVTKKNRSRIVLIRSLSAAAVCLVVAGGIFLAWKFAGNKKDQTITTTSDSLLAQGTDVTAGGTILPSEKVLENIEGINQALGLNLHDLTTLPFTPDQSSYALFGDDAEITYTRGIEDTCMLNISSVRGSFEAIAENYSNSKDVTLSDGTQVSFYGEEDGTGYAIWQCGKHYCSLQFGSAVEESVFEKIITEVNGML